MQQPLIAAEARPLWARSTLRRGLHGDGQPQTWREARTRCPHVEQQWLPLAKDRYWLAGEKRPFAVEYATRNDALGAHVCISGWQL